MTLGRDQVDHPALGQQQQPAAVRQLERVHVRAQVPLYRDGQVGQGPHVDLDVEVAGVGQDGPVPHHGQVLGPDDLG